jgi:hypothetical protein
MISTTKIPGGGSSTPKVLQPGNIQCSINSVTLEKVPYKEGAYHMALQVEGPDMGPEFEGFYIDKDQPSLGRYSGQIGKIRLTEWPFADGTTKSGIVISRDMEVLKALRNLCVETNSAAWLESQDNQHDTIESLVEQFNSDKPFKGKMLSMCVAGREYLNKAGYINYDLYLPKAVKGTFSYKSADNDDKLMIFNDEEHIKKAKTDGGTPVESFGKSEPAAGMMVDVPTTTIIASDFNLDLD